MDSTILELKRALQNAVEKGKSQAACDILSRLADIRITKELLKKTEMGIFVNRLRKNADASIAQHAGRVCDKWKRDVGIMSRPATGAASPRPDVPSSEHTRNNSISLGNPIEQASGHVTPQSGNASPSGAHTPEEYKERSVALDQVKFPSLGDKIREKCVELMYNALCYESLNSKEALARVASQIELALYRKHQSLVTGEYKTDLRMYSSSIKNKRNGDLRTSLVTGDLEAATLVNMSAAELAPGEMKEYMEQVRKKNLFLAQGAGNVKAVTDQFRCGKCKKRRCSYFQMQTRSADEPMTTFVECLECGHNWKFC